MNSEQSQKPVTPQKQEQAVEAPLAPSNAKAPMTHKKRQSLQVTVDIVKDITVILTCVSIVTGIVLSALHLRDDWRHEKFVGLSQARDVIDKEDSIQNELAVFRLTTNGPSPEALLEKYGSGRAVYFSDEMKPYRTICRHYEKVGALLQENYIDFDLYYQIEVFPDYFWDRTLDLRKKIKDNWDGKGRPLNDFLKNFERLHGMYQKRRAAEK